MAKAKKTTEPKPVAEARDYIEYAGRKERIADLPMASVVTLAQRTLNHMMQNEAASKVKTARDKAEAEGIAKGLSGPELAEYVAEGFTEEDEARVKAEFIQARWNAILNGTLGVPGERGPKRKGLEAHLYDAAVAFIKARVKAKGTAMPTGDKLKSAVAFASGLDHVKADAQTRFDAEQTSGEIDADELDEMLG